MATRKEQVEQARQEREQQKSLIKEMNSPSHYREVVASPAESLVSESDVSVSVIGHEPPPQVDEVTLPRALVSEPRSSEPPLSSVAQVAPSIEQLREAARDFDRWHVPRVQLGARVLHKSKQRLTRLQKSLRVRTMGATIDFLLAEAEARLLGRAS